MDSFINFFQLQKSFIYFFISLSFSKQYGRFEGGGGGGRGVGGLGGRGVGGVGGLGPGGDSLLRGATCRGSVDPGLVFSLKKQLNPADACF